LEAKLNDRPANPQQEKKLHFVSPNVLYLISGTEEKRGTVFGEKEWALLKRTHRPNCFCVSRGRGKKKRKKADRPE